MDEAIIKKVQILNWLLAAAMGGAAWLSFSAATAGAVLIGGMIAAASFGFLQRDMRQLLSNPLPAVKGRFLAKGRFLMKYYARLSLLAALLFWLIKYSRIHTLGLLVGLSVVLLSITVAMAGEAKRLYLLMKEAS